MIKPIVSQNGQTMYDLCLMAYRTLDLMIKFCVDNDISDVNYVPFAPQVFLYDTALTIDQKTSNYVYATWVPDAGVPHLTRIYGDAYGDSYS